MGPREIALRIDPDLLFIDGAMQHALSHTSIVLPALNEAAAIADVIGHVPQGVGEILVVAGNSSDDTAKVAKSADAKVQVINRTRRGKGNALVCGFEAALGDYVIALDADGSANPENIPTIMRGLLDGADFVKGYRVRNTMTKEPLRHLANTAITCAFNRKLHTSFTDVCCGYIGFRRGALPLLGLNAEPRESTYLWGDGFEIDVVLLGRAVRHAARISHAPVDYSPRAGGKRKTRAIRDGLRVARALRRA